MHSNEYHPTRVEHQRRKKPGENPYVTNIAMHRHKGMATTATAAAVKPTDSFEDLTGDFEELKIQSADFSKSAWRQTLNSSTIFSCFPENWNWIGVMVCPV